MIKRMTQSLTLTGKTNEKVVETNENPIEVEVNTNLTAEQISAQLQAPKRMAFPKESTDENRTN